MTSAAERGGELLRVDDLQVRFGAVRAVDGVDLSIGRGEVVALVGESGSGKTTLIRALIGLEETSGGTIRFEGEVIGRSDRRRLRRRVQMVFQDPTGALNPRHTVGRAVGEGLAVHKVPGVRSDQVAAALGRSGLRPPERFVDRYPHEISGGQRQRVVIAGALVLEPDLLLADEPVASLDASIRGEILALLRSLVDDQGISILVVTHDLGLAWNIADRVAVMYLGRIVEEGPTEELLADPRHPYTRALLSVVPEAGGPGPGPAREAQILQGETPDASRIPTGCRFHPRCPLVASGAAALSGIEQRCRTEDPVPVELDGAAGSPGRRVACHAAPLPADGPPTDGPPAAGAPAGAAPGTEFPGRETPT